MNPEILRQIIAEAQRRIGNDPKCPGGFATKLNDMKLELVELIDQKILETILRRKQTNVCPKCNYMNVPQRICDVLRQD